MAHLKDLVGKTIVKVQTMNGGDYFDGDVVLYTSDNEIFVLARYRLTDKIYEDEVLQAGKDFSIEEVNKSYKKTGVVRTWGSLNN